MSRVTGVMLIDGSLDEDVDGPISKIKAWLADHEPGAGSWALNEVADHGGGFKHPQFHAWCGGFNHFESVSEEFAAFVMAQDWDYNEDKVVLILEHEEAETRVFRMDRGEWK